MDSNMYMLKTICNTFNNAVPMTEITKCLPRRKLSVPGFAHFKKNILK